MKTRALRFNRTQRTIHWLHALSFVGLLFTGLALYLPILSSWIGHRGLLRQLHLWMAITYFFSPAVIAWLGNRASIRDEVREIDQWEPVDFQWLRRAGRRLAPAWEVGRFNAGQKLHAIFSGAAGIIFGFTGLVMWQGHRFPHWLTQNAIALHDALTWLALAVWLGHVYFTSLHPTTRESLRGMVLGWVKADWAQKHHPG